MTKRHKVPAKADRFNEGDPVWYWRYDRTDDPLPTVIRDAFDYTPELRLYRLELSDATVAAKATGDLTEQHLYARPGDLAALADNLRLHYYGLEGLAERFAAHVAAGRDEDA